MQNKLVLYPNPILATPTVPVVDFEAAGAILDEMKKAMVELGGLGLASNQLGYNLSMFIMQEVNYNNHYCQHMPEDGHNSSCVRPIVEFINPVIIEESKTAIVDQEGCLSTPGVYVSIPRPESLVLEAYKRNGEGFKVILWALEARCGRHEVDHLLGKDYLQLANRQQRRNALRQLGAK